MAVTANERRIIRRFIIGLAKLLATADARFADAGQLLTGLAPGYDISMNLEGARRVMETVSHETANHYLRFGWTLINQYVVAATDDQPAMVRYVLASVRRIEDTRQVLILTDPDEVNEHLQLGWKLIDKHVTASESEDRRDETLHFVVAWQSEDPPVRPGMSPEGEARFEISGDAFDVDVDDVL